MTRIGFDGVTAAHLPAGGDVYFYYANGRYANEAAIKSLHPGKVYGGISVDPSEPAQIYDCEPGNGSPSDAPGWVTLARAAGYDPAIYCGINTWYQQIHAAIAAAGVAQPYYWGADGTKTTIPAGFMALQNRLDVPPGFDQSIVADYWSTIDGLSPQGGGTPITTTPSVQGELVSKLIQATDTYGNVPTGGVYEDNGLTCVLLVPDDMQSAVAVWGNPILMPGVQVQHRLGICSKAQTQLKGGLA